MGGDVVEEEGGSTYVNTTLDVVRVMHYEHLLTARTMVAVTALITSGVIVEDKAP
jgi:hypothetical protein